MIDEKQLREMAEAIISVITKTDTPGGPEYVRDTSRFGYGLKEPYELAAALLKSPAWHERPTGPGLWCIESMGELWQVDESDLSRWGVYGWDEGRVYGPIPADKETAT